MTSRAATTVEFEVINTTYAVTRTVTMRVELPRDSGWFYEAMAASAAATKHKPVHTSNFAWCQDVLPNLNTLPSWHALICRAANEVTATDVLVVYRELEECCYPPVVPITVSRHFAVARNFIRNYLVKECGNTACGGLYNKYASNLRPFTSGRGTISELLSEGPTGSEPVDAIPHDNLNELRERTIAVRRETLKRLNDGIQSEFDRFEDNARWLANHDGWLPFLEYKDLLALMADKGSAARARLAKYPPQTKLRFLLQQAAIIESDKPEVRSTYSAWAYSDIGKYLEKRFPGQRQRFWSIFFYPEIGDERVMHSCMLALQIKTHWNVSSVLGLDLNGVTVEEEGWTIQSIKWKTNGPTPPVFISKKDGVAAWAIQFLLKRMKVMHRIGVHNRTSLFAGTLYYGEAVQNLKPAHEKFIKNHGLPKFSYEQVRNETLALVNIEKGPERARQMAGHAGFGSLNKYTGDPGTIALNSSINLEFTKRLEADIRAAVGNGNSEEDYWPSLRGVGDGSSCREPGVPPSLSWLDGEVCRAEHCHQGGGCKNRVFSVNQERMEEAAYTVIFYANASERLLSANREKFIKVHWPRAVVAKTFQSVLLDGPYAHLMRAAIEGTDEHCGQKRGG